MFIKADAAKAAAEARFTKRPITRAPATPAQQAIDEERATVVARTARLRAARHEREKVGLNAAEAKSAKKKR